MEICDFDSGVFYDVIRKNIIRIRKQQGMTAAQLAEKAGLGHDYLRQIESQSDRHHVSLISLVKLARALNVKLDDLIE